MTTDIRDQPIFTQLVDDAAAFSLSAGAAFVSGRSHEARSQHVEDLRARTTGATFVDLTHQSDESFRWRPPGASEDTVVRLRSVAELTAFWNEVGGAGAYLDITGLTHPIWVPLVATAVAAGFPLKVVYVEPVKYRRNSISAGSELFDLSVGFGGVAPLPGFVSLSDPAEDEYYFVPLLGFEGRRLSYLVSEVAPGGGRTIPVVGVPGFQPEFVAFAYDGNRIPLLDSDAWQDVQFATANCPFSLFYTLEAVATKHSGSFLKIAPIGTKPHGLGAVLFALAHPEATELVYDHPLRMPGRTEGAARLLVYDVSALARLRGFNGAIT